MRILIAGRSGSGKTTLADTISGKLDVPYRAMDPILLRSGLVRRANWREEVARVAAEDQWVTELHFENSVDLLAPPAQFLIWLDLAMSTSYIRLVARTLRRAAAGREVWPGFKEPPLYSVLWRRDHILRWAIRSAGMPAALVADAQEINPHLELVRVKQEDELPSVLQLLEDAAHFERESLCM